MGSQGRRLVDGVKSELHWKGKADGGCTNDIHGFLIGRYHITHSVSSGTRLRAQDVGSRYTLALSVSMSF